MKKIILMAVMAVCTLAANAQTPGKGLSIVPKVGANFAFLTGDEKYSDVKIGVAAGAEALYMIDDMFGISAGAMYSQQGGKGKVVGVDYTISADYVNVPILANAYLAPGLAVKLGVQPGFKVAEKLKAGSVEADTERFESVDISIPIGVSYEMSNIVLDARYNWGVSNMIKNSDNVKMNNNVFQVTLGYRF